MTAMNIMFTSTSPFSVLQTGYISYGMQDFLYCIDLYSLKLENG
jgi:hypothetical protein